MISAIITCVPPSQNLSETHFWNIPLSQNKIEMYFRNVPLSQNPCQAVKPPLRLGRGKLKKIKDLLNPQKANTMEFFTSDGLKETFARISLNIKEETIDEDKAVVKGVLLLKGGKEHEVEFWLVKLNGKWKVNAMQL